MARSCNISTQKEAVLKAVNAVIAAGKTVSEPNTLISFTEDANPRAFDDFCIQLCSTIQGCFSYVGKVRNQLARERALAKFHSNRIDNLPVIWKCLFRKSGIASISAFQQAVNFRLFNDMAIDKFATTTKYEVQPPHVLSCDEENAIGYAGGYVVKKLATQYKKMGTAKAGQFVECLLSMVCDMQETSKIPTHSQWIDSIDRGGLFHISDGTFNFFKVMELCIQRHLPHHLTSSSTHDTKELLLKTVTDDENVQYYWHTLTIDISDAKDADELLKRIVDTWVTIRGFAITSSWLEQYKMTTNKSTTKRKGLRKEIANG